MKESDNMNNYAINEALNVTLKEKGVPVLFSDYANTSGLDFTSDQVYAKAKGVDTIRFDKNRKATCKFDFEIFNMKYIAIFLGANQEKGTSEISKVHTGTVGKLSKFTVQGTPVLNSLVAFTTETDGRTHKEALTVTVSGSEVTITTPSSVPEGTPVIAYYLTLTGESTIKTTINANKFAKEYQIVGETVSKDVLGELVPVEFNIYRAVPQGNISLSFGDAVSTLSVTFDILPNTNKDLVDIKEITTP